MSFDPFPRKHSIRISQEILGRSKRNPVKWTVDNNPFKEQQPPDWVKKWEDNEKRIIPTIAQDQDITESWNWAYNSLQSAWAEGLVFPGYAELSLLAIRAEYRIVAETLASEHTREWIEFKATGKDPKSDKIKHLQEVINKKYHLKKRFIRYYIHDAFFGRAHLYLNFGPEISDDREELLTSAGNGRDEISKRKVGKGSLKGFRNIEPVWVYPTSYNSNDPLKDDWYTPQTWHVMGKQVHCSRLLTLITREVPDLLKPAYSFGGLSMSQMLKPYVDNWLRTRQSVADIVHAFSVFVLATDLATQLAPDGSDELFRRLELFNNLRDNRGVMAINKDSEEFQNVSAPLGGLDQLQAQTQEHLACLVGDTLIITDRGQIPICDVCITDKVLTRNGWAPLNWCGRTGFVDELVEIKTDKLSLRATSWHPIFLSKINDFVPVGNVKNGDFLLEAEILSRENTAVSVVKNFMFHSQEKEDCIVATNVRVKPTIVATIKNLKEKELVSVYNLEVASGYLPEFFANGILVHNSISRIPLVKLLGIQPAGLNASSEGEIRVFYDSIGASQEDHLRDPLETCINFIQLSEFGEVDEELTFDFKGLWQLDDAGKAAIQKTKADTHTAYMTDGVVSAEEVREAVANDKDSPYQGLDLTQSKSPAEEEQERQEIEQLLGLNQPEAMMGAGGNVTPIKPRDPNSRLASSVTNRAANFGGAASGGFGEGRDESANKNDIVDVYDVYRIGHDSEKIDKDKAKYTDDSTTPQHCVQCLMFNPPNSCSTVEGTINPEGWCKFFEYADEEKEKQRRGDNAQTPFDILDEFIESEHPRGQPENKGQFVEKGQQSSGRSSSKTAHLVSLPKEQWPKHIQKLRIPPVWQDVKISLDPKTPLQAVGRDAKGRPQYIYSAKFKDSQTAKKFSRIKRLDNKYDQIKAQNDKALVSKNELVREHALVTALIMEMGLRPGSERETGAEEKAYGATTLQSNHVIVDDDGNARLAFTGKKGVKLNLPITDDKLAHELLERAKKGGSLFPQVSDRSLLQYVNKLNGGGFKTKDLRTLKATSLAYALVSAMDMPTSKAAYKKAVKAVAVAVSSKLGNTPTVALQSYINPTVFAPWQGVLE